MAEEGGAILKNSAGKNIDDKYCKRVSEALVNTKFYAKFGRISYQ
jgi:hypothetical protein